MGSAIVIKREGREESYKEKKVLDSCYFACRSSHLTDSESKRISKAVAKQITAFVKKARKGQISSDDIFKMLAKTLRKYNKDAAFLYETHRDIS